MKALRFTNNRLAVAEVPRPESPGEALVRVTLSGICNTDLEIVRGYAGFAGTIGHEFVGVVETAPGRPDLVGQRVVGEINAGCGDCARCRAGDPRHCSTRTVLGIVGRDGAHAEYLSLPSVNLLPVPAEVPDEHAVFAEPLAAALGILDRVKIEPDDTVAVIGDGKLGLLCAQAVATAGSPVTLVGKHTEKMRLVEARGIDTVLLDDARKRAGTFTVVVEASGAEGGFQLGLDLLEPRGTLVLKSTFHGEPRWPAARVVVDEFTIVGSRCGRFAPALELLQNGAVDVAGMITEEFPLTQGERAMNFAAQPGVMKVLLRP
jgi:threonine dehydrogenase-like Zn-dependent dehydrogenase